MSVLSSVEQIRNRLGRVARSLASADGRQLRHYGENKLGLSRECTYALIRIWKSAMGLGSLRCRRSRWRELHFRCRVNTIRIAEQTGYTKIQSEELQGVQPIVRRLQEIARECGRSPEDRRKTFRQVLVGESEIVKYPELISFVTQDQILKAVGTYFGGLPFLRTCQVWLSPVSDTTISSQLFHVDGSDDRNVKIFVLGLDCDKESGPLTVVDAKTSERVLRQPNLYHGRLRDEDVFSFINPDDVLESIGKAGDAFLVDTNRCIHFGSRVRMRPRLVLVGEFQRFNAPIEPLHPLRLPHDLFPGDEVRRAVLGMSY